MYPCSLSALVPPTTDDPEKKKKGPGTTQGPYSKINSGADWQSPKSITTFEFMW